MRNDFEIMCKRLEKCRRGCECNPYKCAKEAVENYVGEDRNKLLQLKAEVKGGDFYSFAAFRLAVIALIVTFINTCLDYTIGEILLNIRILITATCVVLALLSICRYNDVLKWGKYISVAVEEYEERLTQGASEE